MSADGSRSSNSALKSRVDEIERAYVAANPKSKLRFEEAAGPMPGGNTRTVLHFSPFPLGFARGEGCFVEDLDGHRYTDFLGEYSAGLYGHSEPLIVDAIQKALKDGIVLGGPNRYEAGLAAELCRRFPSIDQVRFTNSGTEANLLAFAAARLATGRQAIMVMEGGYHGGVLYFGQHKSEINVHGPWVYGHFNDVEHTRATIEREARNLAAIVLEPMMGSAGGLCATPEYLTMLRQECDRHGIVLIYDEVMSSRHSYGGLQKRLGILPDMTTLGKYFGGGLSFGAFGGKAAIMQRFDPRRPDAVSHAGTFNNNVLSMAAGLAGASKLLTSERLEDLFQKGETLRSRLNEVAKVRGVPIQALGIGSIVGFHFKRGPIRQPQDVWPRDKLAAEVLTQLYTLLHLAMIAEGFYFARRGYLTLSLPMEGRQFDGLVEAYDRVLERDGALIAELVDR